MHFVSATYSNQRLSIWSPGPLISNQGLLGVLRYLCLGMEGVNVFVRLGCGVLSEAPSAQLQCPYSHLRCRTPSPSPVGKVSATEDSKQVGDASEKQIRGGLLRVPLDT